MSYFRTIIYDKLPNCADIISHNSQASNCMDRKLHFGIGLLQNRPLHVTTVCSILQPNITSQSAIETRYNPTLQEG